MQLCKNLLGDEVVLVNAPVMELDFEDGVRGVVGHGSYSVRDDWFALHG